MYCLTAAPIDMSLEKPSIPDLMEGHRSVLELQLKPDCNITSSALSEDGNWIVVADVENIRLFQLQQVVSLDERRIQRKSQIKSICRRGLTSLESKKCVHLKSPWANI